MVGFSHIPSGSQTIFFIITYSDAYFRLSIGVRRAQQRQCPIGKVTLSVRAQHKRGSKYASSTKIQKQEEGGAKAIKVQGKAPIHSINHIIKQSIFEIFFFLKKRLYNYKCPSVCQSGLRRNAIFSAANQDRGLISSSYATDGCCHPCLIYVQFFYM